jgi:site-specific recombinase XerD
MAVNAADVRQQLEVKPGFTSSATMSRRAMRGAPARAIQELAGHQDLETTQRYMH